MQLPFEHRHSLHASHPTSSLSLEQDEDKSETGGEARAGHASGVLGESVQPSTPASTHEPAGEGGKMHATTARNNGFLRYLHGVPALCLVLTALSYLVLRFCRCLLLLRLI